MSLDYVLKYVDYVKVLYQLEEWSRKTGSPKHKTKSMFVTGTRLFEKTNTLDQMCRALGLGIQSFKVGGVRFPGEFGELATLIRCSLP